MKAYMYEVSIVEGSLAMTHGWSQRIKEIWVPEFNIIFNEKDGAFYSETPRNKVYPKGTLSLIDAQTEDSSMEEIDVEIDDIRVISTYVQATDPAKKTMKKVFDEKGRYHDPESEAYLGSIVHQDGATTG